PHGAQDLRHVPGGIRHRLVHQRHARSALERQGAALPAKAARRRLRSRAHGRNPNHSLGSQAQDMEYRDIRYEYSSNLPSLLTQLGISLLVSTYQTGNLVVIAADQGQLALSFHGFDRAMGMAVKADGLAVASRNQVWVLASAPDLAGKLAPAGRYDAC